MPSTLGIVSSQISPHLYGTGNSIIYYDTKDPASYNGTGTTMNNPSFGGGSLVGTIVGSPVYTGGTDKYLTWNTNSHVYTSNLRTFFTGDKPPITIEVWAYPTANGVLLTVNGASIPNSGYHHSAIELVGGKPYFRLWLSSPLSSPTTIPFNNWYQFVITYDGDKLQGFVNGNLVATLTSFNWVTPIEDNSASDFRFMVGAPSGTNMGSGGGRFQGRWGVLKIYNRALSSVEVTDSFNTLRGSYGI